MFIKPVSKIFIVLLVLAVAAVNASFLSRPAPASAADRSYDGAERMRADRNGIDSSYNLIEQVRVARTINALADRSYGGLEQIRANRYYVESKKQALREHSLGERYGQTSLSQSTNCRSDECYFQLPNGLWIK